MSGVAYRSGGGGVTTVASLCMGYGGLDLALEEVLGTETVWCSEIDKHASLVIEARWGVPNLGDLKVVDWTTVEPVDVLTAGYPCQPFSVAGQRKGTDDPRHLWPYIADALRVLRPRLALFENVAGHLGLGFDVVLADLAAIGFDAEWKVVRASDVGACHQRERLFILAADAERGGWRQEDPRGRGVVGEGGVQAGRHEGAGSPRPDSDAAPDAGRQRHGRGEVGRGVGRLDRGDAGEARQRERARALTVDRGGEAPSDATSESEREQTDEANAIAACWQARAVTGSGDRGAWGDYGPAIEQHGRAVGRPAPAPVDVGGVLDARFVEWMMMLPEGWVTDLLPRNPALKMLGNGVVPAQAAYALRLLLPRLFVREVAA